MVEFCYLVPNKYTLKCMYYRGKKKKLRRGRNGGKDLIEAIGESSWDFGYYGDAGK